MMFDVALIIIMMVIAYRLYRIQFALEQTSKAIWTINEYSLKRKVK